MRSDDLPPGIVTLAALYERCGGDFELALDMAAPHAAHEVVRIAERHGARDRLWLTYWRLGTLGDWRKRWPDVHLVMPALALPGRAPRRRIAALAGIGVHVINLHHRTLSAAAVREAQAAGLDVFAWGLRSRRQMERAVRLGVAGLFADDVPLMVEAVAAAR